MPVGRSKQLRIHSGGVVRPCQRRCLESERRGGVSCCCGRGVGEEDEGEAWGFHGDAAGVGASVAVDGDYVEFAFRPAVYLESVSEGLKFQQ